MDIGARALLLEEGRGGAARVEAALEVNSYHRIEIVGPHFVEIDVAKVSGIVHHRIDATEAVDRGLHHRAGAVPVGDAVMIGRSEEHTSEIQSLMRISSAVFCFK